MIAVFVEEYSTQEEGGEGINVQSVVTIPWLKCGTETGLGLVIRLDYDRLRIGRVIYSMDIHK